MKKSYRLPYEQIQEGDYVVLERKFSRSEFFEFAKLSHDFNELHHDRDYAQISGFNDPIVPAMLYSSVVSEGVGMYLPGRNALIGSVRFQSIEPLYYGEKFSCSLMVVSKDNLKETILLRIVARSGIRLIFKGFVTVKVRKEDVGLKGSLSDNSRIHNNNCGAMILVGAGSTIGQTVAKQLAIQGFDLILLFHSNKRKAGAFCDELKEFGTKILLHKTADVLKNADNLSKLDESFASAGGIVFLDSPPVEATLAKHLEGSYKVPRQLMEGILPHWLNRQRGRAVFVGTGSSLRESTESLDYSVGKLAGMHYFQKLNLKYRSVGISSHSVLLDAVRTRFWEKSSMDASDPMDPMRAANAIVSVLLDQTQRDEDFSWIGTDFKERRKLFGEVQNENCLVKDSSVSASGENDERRPDKTEIMRQGSNQSSQEDNGSDQSLAKIVAEVLGITADTLGAQSGMGITPEWTSIKQIEVLYAVEKAFNRTFSSFEAYNATTMKALGQLIKE